MADNTIDLFDQWYEAPLLLGYIAAGAYSARQSFQRRYQSWMDKEIRTHLTWASNKPDHRLAKESPENTHERLKEKWKEEGHEDALLNSLAFGAAWPVMWVLHWTFSKPAPSQQEQLLMDRAAHQRLRELERQAGLIPLDEEDGRA